jgi:hypothetical protein
LFRQGGDRSHHQGSNVVYRAAILAPGYVVLSVSEAKRAKQQQYKGGPAHKGAGPLRAFLGDQFAGETVGTQGPPERTEPGFALSD